MQFILIAYDGTDGEAPLRRSDVRPDHLKNVDDLRQKGEFLFGGAILDDNKNMIGSVIVYEFPDRQALNKMLEKEPYIVGKVWERIDIKAFRLAKHD
jgi:uncharacterized protein YciI